MEDWSEFKSPCICLLIDTGDSRILVDTGAGGLGPDTGDLVKNLRSAGVDPSQIDLASLVTSIRTTSAATPMSMGMCSSPVPGG